MAKLIMLRAHTNSNFQLEAFSFYQILEYTFEEGSFFEKYCFIATFIQFRSKSINYSFQGLRILTGKKTP